jgi:5-methyltetrahydrofolate--homocysteine methyltransferase
VDLQGLLSKGVAVGDGAMGTELQRAGLAVGECGERWVLEHPDRVEAIHAAYIAAGSQAIITNTFGANRWVLGRYGLDARRELETEFARQARALLEGGADGIIIETMSALEEVTAAIRAARAEGAPFVIASLAFDRLPNGAVRTMMGVSPQQAADAIAAEGAQVIGANCGTRMIPADFTEVTRAFAEAATLPVMIQANAGSPELVDGRAVYRLSPDAFADGMAEVIAAGARLVGGCCGTTPAHIAALAARVRRLQSA